MTIVETSTMFLPPASLSSSVTAARNKMKLSLGALTAQTSTIKERRSMAWSLLTPKLSDCMVVIKLERG